MQAYSGLIIALNEAHNIAECIASLRQVCDDVVVVDAGSRDDTAEIARRAGATLIVQAPFLGDGPQRSVGLRHCRHDWVVNLDADERLDADLVETLKSGGEWGVDALECARRNYVGGRFTPYAGQYPDYVCRVFDRRRADFAPVRTHSRVQAKSTRRIDGHITHYSYRDFDDLFARANKYSSWQAEEMLAHGKRASLATAAVHGAASFVKHYVFKRGFLAGVDGLTISVAKAMTSYLKYAKLAQLGKARERRA